jgi:hypothetical protein
VIGKLKATNFKRCPYILSPYNSTHHLTTQHLTTQHLAAGHLTTRHHNISPPYNSPLLHFVTSYKSPLQHFATHTFHHHYISPAPVLCCKKYPNYIWNKAYHISDHFTVLALLWKFTFYFIILSEVLNKSNHQIIYLSTSSYIQNYTAII